MRMDAAEPDPIRVLLADDEPGLRVALSELLSHVERVELIGTAADAEEAIRIAEVGLPDVALVYVRMPEGGGPHAARGISRVSPATRVIALSAYEDRANVLEPFTLVHGSPRDPTWEYVFSASVARANLQSFDTDHCLVGHTHVPIVFRERKTGGMETALAKPGSRIRLDGARTLVNPGSVGQPRDGDPRASAMILDTEKKSVEWRRVQYPIEKTQKLMSDLDLPPRLVARLQFGL